MRNRFSSLSSLSSLSSRGAGLGFFSLLAATSLLLGACVDNRQIGGEGGNGGGTTSSQTSTSTSTNATTSTGGTTGGGGGGTGGGGQADSNIALLDMLIPQVPAATKNKWLDAGETLDPTTLLVIVSSESQACNAPVFDFGTKDHHQVLIGLPKSLQKVGKYDLSSPDVIAFGSSWLSDGMGNGGGLESVLTAGTVEVLSIDVSTINVRLEGLSADFTTQNGEHLATICPSGV